MWRVRKARRPRKLDRPEQSIKNIGALDDVSHEHEQWHGNQHVIGHHRPCGLSVQRRGKHADAIADLLPAPAKWSCVRGQKHGQAAERLYAPQFPHLWVAMLLFLPVLTSIRESKGETTWN